MTNFELEASKLKIEKPQFKLQNLEDIVKIDAQVMEDWKSKYEELKEENFNYLKQINDIRTKNDALQQQVDGLQKRIQTITAHKESFIEAVNDLTSSKSAREQTETELSLAAEKLQNFKEEMQRKFREQQEEYD
uniref:Uncharacterized protein n=1 Tax=Panagrolaimus davidi TaxID=227884 RepID=A0A914PFT2_9BILA